MVQTSVEEDLVVDQTRTVPVLAVNLIVTMANTNLTTALETLTNIVVHTVH